MQAFRKFLCSFALLLVSQQILAQGGCEQWLGKLASAQGKVEIRRAGTSIWRPVMRGERYCDMDAIRTGRNSRAVLMLNTDPSNRTLTNLNQNTFLTFKSLVGGEPNALELLIDLLKGGALFRSRQPNRLGIETPYVNAAHRGTEFFVRVDPDQSLVTVYDGKVATSNTEGKLTIDKGETALAKRGKAPVKYALVRSRDAVQWALHYPPVIDYHAASSTPSHPAIGDALSAYRRGDLLEGLAILDKAPEAQREPDYYTTKAGLLLSVGRVDYATPAIGQALKLDPKNASAFALKSVIAVAQNRNDEAMQLAEHATQLDPESPTPQVALSYAHQAKFELEEALESAEKAVEFGPGNARALSRLSELKLSMGDLDEALEAAEKAAVLDPDLARTQTVLGFAYLTKIDIDEARQTFEKAIELDQSAPLPHLGLGLAKIRKGELKNGTDEIEIAASLDPDNSLIRSYLGKAFYEKKENILAGTELEIAKELDPNDPTPWFYDAIRKQTTNRPVEALHDMQKAIELNDNRAVYRSRLLLDDDLAARSASLGRIYNDLGFQQRGLLEGWKSVNADPSNYSAHRLLADNYAVFPRHEIARVSELLQSQLLQPINITPVQPELAESQLGVLDGAGPSALSFNEFNPLFTRNKVGLLANGIFGNKDISGDEIVASGLYKKVSFSAGQFHYETDGFRKNNDQKQDAYNAFIQTALTPNTNVQFEYRYLDKRNGDLSLNFDRNLFSETLFESRIVNTARLGFNHQFSRHSQTIGSAMYSKRDVTSDTASQDTSTQTKGYIFEVQHLFQFEFLKITAGIGTFRANSDRENVFDFSPAPCLIPELAPSCIDKESDNIDHNNGYVYSDLSLDPSIILTMGFSINSVNNEFGDKTQVNPKLGIVWNIQDYLTIRAASFRTLKRNLLVDQTIERTQVAGFNQFFDETNSVSAWRHGLAFDFKPSDLFYYGIELSLRDLNVPFRQLNGTRRSNWSESQIRSYSYWTPHPWWAIGLKYQFEHFDETKEFTFGTLDLKTHKLPLSIGFFHPSGITTNFVASYYRQSGKFIETAIEGTPTISDKSDFFILDFSIGYRLPKRYGKISLNILNLLDKDFKFEDRDEGKIPRIAPKRTIFGLVSLAF